MAFLVWIFIIQILEYPDLWICIWSMLWVWELFAILTHKTKCTDTNQDHGNKTFIYNNRNLLELLQVIMSQVMVAKFNVYTLNEAQRKSWSWHRKCERKSEGSRSTSTSQYPLWYSLHAHLHHWSTDNIPKQSCT